MGEELVKCPACGMEIPTVEIDERSVERKVREYNYRWTQGWDNFAHSNIGVSLLVPGLGTVTLVHAEPDFIVVEVDGRYFRKERYENSYGDFCEWGYGVTEVERKEKTIVQYSWE